MRAFDGPVVVLGVSRSGTGLLRAILDQHSAIAIPSESHFLQALWDRHEGRPDTPALFRDLGVLRRIREWGVDLEDLRRRVPAGATLCDVIQEVYRSYARARGKVRFGDKTPGHMRHLERLEQTFRGAQYVHMVRDGRDAALSYAQMAHRPRLTLASPAGTGDFARCWRLEVAAARRLGDTVGPGRYFELRYEDLVSAPAARIRDVCAYLGVSFEPGMLEFHRNFHARPRSNHRRLAEPPTPGLRDWRTEMDDAEVERFEVLAGDLLEDLGYARRSARPSRRARVRAVLDRAVSRARLGAERVVMPAFHRSRLWRRREWSALERLAATAPRSSPPR